MATLSFSAANGMKSKSYVLTYSVSSSSTATTVTLTSVSCESSSWTGANLTVFFYADSTATLITSFKDTLSPNQTTSINKTHSWNKTTSAQTKRLYVYVSAYVDGSYVNYGQASVEISVPALASYNVTYNANGGSGAPATQKKYYGVNLTLSVVKPTRSGFSFVKWFTKANGTGTGYNPGAIYSSNAALNLYAKWSAVPSVTSLKVIRSDSSGNQDDSGTYASVTATWTMSSATSESATVTGTITPQGGTSSAITLSGTTTGTGGTVTALVPNMDTDTQYVVAITAANGSNTATRSAVLTRAFFIMDFKAGGGGIGIGRAAPSDSLAVGYNAEFDGNVDIFGNLDASGNATIGGNLDASGSLTINGNSTVNGSLAKFKGKVINYVNGQRGTTPSANQYRAYEFQDTNGKRLSQVEHGLITDGKSVMNLWVLGHNASEDAYGGIQIYKTNGNTGNYSAQYNANTGRFYTRSIETPDRAVSYIDGAKGDAALYARKAYNQDHWYPAVCLETKGGGSWSMGNYNNEYLQFSYATKANRDSGTNQTTIVNLPNNPGTIPVPVQLYYNATGVDGTITLSQTAANFNYLRIYYKKNGDENACGSTDVYSPNGKKASLMVANYSGSTHQIMEKIVTISAKSITKTSEGYINYQASNTGWNSGTTDTTLFIYRVEGWK